MSGKKKTAKNDAERLNKLDREVMNKVLQRKDEEEWKDKKGIKKVPKLQKGQQTDCSARIKKIENECFRIYKGPIDPKRYCKTRNCKRCKELFLAKSNEKYKTQCNVEGENITNTRNRSNAVGSKPSKKRFTGDQPLKF